jgi:SAM-dependent methyltransferase
MPYRPVLEPHVERYIGADLPRNVQADVHLDEFGRVALSDESVDIVLSSQVLEHVPSPQGYLAEANRLLKPGGKLLLSTHGYWKYHPDPTDFWRWTRDGLVKEIEAAGFEVDAVRGVMGLGATGLQLFQDGATGRIPRHLRPIFFYLLNRFMAVVDWLTSEESRNIDACVFVVRASKRDA